MMVWMVSIVTIIILGVGFYFCRKQLSRGKRAAVAGLALATCAILWLTTFAPNAPMEPSAKDDQSPSQSRSQKAITGPSSGTKAPAAQAAQTTPVKPTTQAIVAKTTPSDVDQASAPVSDTIATDDATTEPDPVVAKVNDHQLDALIGDAVPVKLEGSTMVNAIVKKGAIKAAERNTPSEDDYSFPQVVVGSDGMVMIIPDEPLPSQSSRRQLTTGDDDIPGPGEVVALSYDMFSWSTGKMVESSQTAVNGPLMYRLGGIDTPVAIPKYLDEAIHNRPYGSTIQVVFEKEMPDLPGYMDRNDGYVLVVRVDKPDLDGETALENMMEAMNK